MLLSLYIKNFILIEEMQVDLSDHLTLLQVRLVLVKVFC